MLAQQASISIPILFSSYTDSILHACAASITLFFSSSINPISSFFSYACTASITLFLKKCGLSPKA
jgi:hypothetical protein